MEELTEEYENFLMSYAPIAVPSGKEITVEIFKDEEGKLCMVTGLNYSLILRLL